VRLHWLMAMMMGIYLAQAATDTGWMGVGMMLATLVILLLSVLIHELGHCWMAIHHHGTAEKILIWPLGGLSFLDYNRGPRQQIQVSGIGPLSSLALSALFFGILIATGVAWHWGYALPYEHWYPAGFSLVKIFLLHAARLNLLLGLFNLVIPAYPLDGGQVLFGFLNLKFGPLRAAQAMVAISIPVGAALAIFGFSMGQIFLGFIGISVMYEAFQLRTRIRVGDLDSFTGGAAQYEYMPDRPQRKGTFARWKENRARKALARDEARDRESRVRVDEVLDKVSREGIGSLTPDEKRILDEASRRSRGED
jgi:stage IV sporulation protein FB